MWEKDLAQIWSCNGVFAQGMDANIYKTFQDKLRWPFRVLEGINYYTNCYCLIALAYERYVYTVKYSEVKVLLSTRRRTIIYSTIGVLSAVIPALRIVDVYVTKHVKYHKLYFYL